MKGDLEDVKHELALLVASSTFTFALAGVDAEKGATRATPEPTAVIEAEKATTSDQGYPVCEVIGYRTTYGLSDQQTKTATHEIDVLWTQMGDDEIVITTDLQRLVRAVRDVLWPATGPIGLPAVNSEPIVIVAEEYTALMPSKTHPFVKGAATSIRVTTESL